jgi:hypothetical protein
MIDTKKLREVAEKAWKELPKYLGNPPFYVDVPKPRQSMSKHDLERPTYWNYDDGVFVAVFQPSLVLELLDEIDRLRDKRMTVKELRGKPVTWEKIQGKPDPSMLETGGFGVFVDAKKGLRMQIVGDYGVTTSLVLEVEELIDGIQVTTLNSIYVVRESK